MSDVADEARQLLASVGAEGIRVEKDPRGYLVAARFSGEGFDGQAHSGHTGIDPNTSDDPRDMASRLIAISRAAFERNTARKRPVDAWEEPAAALTEEPTFTPENDPFGRAIEEPHAAIPESQAPSEPAEAEPHSVGGGSEAAAAEDAGSAEDGPAGGGGALLAHDGQAWESDSGIEPDYDLEAEFTEIAAEELTEAADLLELEAPDLGEDIVAAEDEAATGDQARFYGLDDLDRVRRLRIGDVAASAAVRVNAIEAMVSEKDGEFATIQGYVVSNLDKHTGAFTPQDEASLATYARFLELSEARNRIAAIDQRRKDATAYLLDETRTREEVVAFDPEADWPVF